MNDNKILADRLVEAKAQVSTMDSTSKLLVDVLDQVSQTKSRTSPSDIIH
jgi:hypothetical protein